MTDPQWSLDSFSCNIPPSISGISEIYAIDVGKSKLYSESTKILGQFKKGVEAERRRLLLELFIALAEKSCVIQKDGLFKEKKTNQVAQKKKKAAPKKKGKKEDEDEVEDETESETEDEEEDEEKEEEEQQKNQKKKKKQIFFQDHLSLLFGMKIFLHLKIQQR